MWFAILWLPIVYVPIAHCVWGNGWLMKPGILDFAGGTVVHLNAGVAGLVAAYVVGRRAGYGSENFGLIVPLRVSKESEIDGLDLTQHGEAIQ